jgi:hypothetical protein
MDSAYIPSQTRVPMDEDNQEIQSNEDLSNEHDLFPFRVVADENEPNADISAYTTLLPTGPYNSLYSSKQQSIHKQIDDDNKKYQFPLQSNLSAKQAFPEKAVNLNKNQFPPQNINNFELSNTLAANQDYLLNLESNYQLQPEPYEIQQNIDLDRKQSKLQNVNVYNVSELQFQQDSSSDQSREPNNHGLMTKSQRITDLNSYEVHSQEALSTHSSDFLNAEKLKTPYYLTNVVNAQNDQVQSISSVSKEVNGLQPNSDYNLAPFSNPYEERGKVTHYDSYSSSNDLKLKHGNENIDSSKKYKVFDHSVDIPEGHYQSYDFEGTDYGQVHVTNDLLAGQDKKKKNTQIIITLNNNPRIQV